MNKTDILCAFFSRLATIIIVAFLGGGNRVFGISSLPIAPTSGATEPATLAVASAIKPTATPGAVAVSINEQLGIEDADARFVVFVPSSGYPRIVALPATVTDATALSAEVLIATVTPVSGDTSESPAWEVVEDASEDAAAVTDAFAPAPPSKNVASAINAVIDAVKKSDGFMSSPYDFAVTYDQAAETLKVYSGTAGTLTGKIGDVQMLAPESGVATRSMRAGS